MGAALYGTVLGSLVGGWPADHFGRRKTLISIGLLYVLSAVGCALAWNAQVFILARFIGGIGIGISTVVAPLYISEIAPPGHRGKHAGQSLGSATHWVFAAVLTTAFPAMVSAISPGYIFLFFCAMMVLQLIWVRLVVPETKGIPLEQIQRTLGIRD